MTTPLDLDRRGRCHGAGLAARLEPLLVRRRSIRPASASCAFCCGLLVFYNTLVYSYDLYVLRRPEQLAGRADAELSAQGLPRLHPAGQLDDPVRAR